MVGGSGGGGGAVVGDGGVAGPQARTGRERDNLRVALSGLWLVGAVAGGWSAAARVWLGRGSLDTLVADGVAQSTRYRSRPVARAFPAGHRPSLGTHALAHPAHTRNSTTTRK